ncbi:ubiquitin carboxyl-terminal hydrolase 7 [Lutzomyia longipalpis]|nr:ubiquitin carboxyl-terminal hydrolase 7 [Lutzomyia longipalpis]
MKKNSLGRLPAVVSKKMETDTNGRDVEAPVEKMDTQDLECIDANVIPANVCDTPMRSEEFDETLPMEENVDFAPLHAFGQPQTTEAPREDSTMEEEDHARSEATFTFRVEEFSKLNEQLLSPPCYVRNLPWKIMVMPRITQGSGDRPNADNRSLGFFLQCNGENDSPSWTCKATADLSIHNFKADAEPLTRKITHVFYSKENDWGFSHFMSWNDVLDPEKGYIMDDAIVLEVHVVAEAPHGVFWDSKKYTGYVGLKNQGATCYMNSLLQTLYFTNHLRKAVYKMPTEADDSSKSVALALQRVFQELQFSDKPVGTKKLTKSFGWETLDSFMQHDVQEFLRVLLDKLESKMKGTCLEGTIPRLFEGKMSSYIKCKNVEYTSTRIETFYDIQLNIKGKKNIDESFKDYVATETLDDDNKYDAGEHGLQEAEKGVIFVSFPPVLHLHLMRFQYDPVTDNSVKFNDRFEFYEHISLDAYLQEPEATPAEYTLHAVLVHSGDNHGGHYVVYINPLGDGKWCKFDDDVVSRCTKAEAIDHNYGGLDDDLSLQARHCSNAYMLVYIRDSALPTVLQDISEQDIPSELVERLAEEKRMEQVRRLERSEANAYMNVHIVLEEYFEGHQVTDLFDYEKVHLRVFRVKRTATMTEFMGMLVDAFRTPADQMRLWPLSQRHSQLTRPVVFDIQDDGNKSVITVADSQNPWTVFLEIMSPDAGCQHLPVFDKETDVLLFFKYYDPNQKKLHYVGHGYYNLTMKIGDLVPDLLDRVGWSRDTQVILYEEQASGFVVRINNFNETIEKSMREITDGDIVIFEKREKAENLELPTVEDYFRDLLYRVEVTFIDKTNPNDTGFTLELSQRMSYDQWVKVVGQRMNVDPYEIQFFKCQTYKDVPGNALRSSYDGTLKDILIYNKPKSTKKIFYQILSMNINELETKKQFKCLWVSQNLKEEKEIVLYPSKCGTVKTLLDEAGKQVEFSEGGSRRLRVAEIVGHKLVMGPSEDTQLECLQTSAEQTLTNQKVYRIEEVPKDEVNLAADEQLVPVTHFYKDIYNTFGIPFFIKVKNGEPYASVRRRIKARLGVPDKEWEKYKLAILTMNRIDYITEDEGCVNVNDFRSQTTNNPRQTAPYFGLEHINKLQKRSRFSYLEKAIKIYN